MSTPIPFAFNGDPNYTEQVCQDFLISLGWSRKRRKKWLRRAGLRLTPHWDDFPFEFDSGFDDDDDENHF